MNNVNILGRLTRDVDLRMTNSNFAVGRFNVAVDRKLSKEKRMEAESNNQPTADFISCIAFGRTAENIATYFKKGQRIAVSGHIQTGSYEKMDKEFIQLMLLLIVLILLNQIAAVTQILTKDTAIHLIWVW